MIQNLLSSGKSLFLVFIYFFIGGPAILANERKHSPSEWAGSVSLSHGISFLLLEPFKAICRAED